MAEKQKPNEEPQALDVKALLDSLPELSDEQLTESIAKLVAHFEVLAKEPSDDNLASLENEIAPAIVTFREALTAREADRKTREEKVAALTQKVKVADPPTAKAEEEEEEEEAAAPAPKVEETKPAEEAVVETPKVEVAAEEVVLEAVAAAAARPSLQTLNERRPAEMAPKVEAKRAKLTIVAGGDVPGYSAGAPFGEFSDVADAFIRKVDSLQGARLAEGARYPVATFRLDYPEERHLSKEDVIGNSRKVTDVIGPQALTAAGGLCAPLEGYYNMNNVPATDARPLRDGLAKFNAARGGIRFISPPALSDLTSAIGVWTETNDTTPGSDGATTKPCLTVTCGSEVSVTIQAVTLCLRIGNFSRMTFPEQWAAWYELALAAHARVAEGQILNAMSTASTAITTGQVLGASRDIFDNLDRVTTRYRSFHRMAPESTLQVAFPFWVRNIIRADIVREMAGDGMEHFGVADAWINARFAERNVDPIWYLDTRTGAGQVFGAQAAGAAHPWILTAEWYVFTPGSFLFLDGGTLDLGVEIRDTTLISTNDVQAFMETFEAVAHVGPEALRVRSSLCVNGSAGSLASVTCATGS